MIKNKLCEILAMHKAWLDNPSKGKRADLTGANLIHAVLIHADLIRADTDSSVSTTTTIR